MELMHDRQYPYFLDPSSPAALLAKPVDQYYLFCNQVEPADTVIQ